MVAECLLNQRTDYDPLFPIAAAIEEGLCCISCGQWLPDYKELIDNPPNRFRFCEPCKEKQFLRFGPDKISIFEMTKSKKACNAAGHSHYFTGHPCRNRHYLLPRTARGDCVGCNQEQAERYRKYNPKALKDAQDRFRRKNRAKK